MTRTTTGSGDVRTVIGPDGSSYSVTHDTNGANTGWDSTVSPAPTDGGIVLTCAAGGCEAGKNLVIGGSHLTATVMKSGGKPDKFWNHTVSTGTGGITVTGTGADRVASGTVTVQHNLAKFTTTTTFDNVAYGDPALAAFPPRGVSPRRLTTRPTRARPRASRSAPTVAVRRLSPMRTTVRPR